MGQSTNFGEVWYNPATGRPLFQIFDDGSGVAVGSTRILNGLGQVPLSQVLAFPWVTVSPVGSASSGFNNGGADFGPAGSTSGTGGWNEAYQYAASNMMDVHGLPGVHTPSNSITPVQGTTKYAENGTFYYLPAVIGEGQCIFDPPSSFNGTAVFDTSTTPLAHTYSTHFENLDFELYNTSAGALRIYTTGGNLFYLKGITSYGYSGTTYDIIGNLTNPNTTWMQEVVCTQYELYANGLVLLDMVFSQELSGDFSYITADTAHLRGVLSNSLELFPGNIAGVTGGSIFNLENCWFAENPAGPVGARIKLNGAIQALTIRGCFFDLLSTALTMVTFNNSGVGSLTLDNNLIQVATESSGNFVANVSYLDRLCIHPNNTVALGSGASFSGNGYVSLIAGTAANAYYLAPLGFGLSTPGLPGGTGSANKVTNAKPWPVRVYQSESSLTSNGTHIIDPTGNDKALPDDPPEFTLDPGAAVYYASSVPSSWIWYATMG